MGVNVKAPWPDGEDVVLPTGASYGPGQPAEVVVRKRDWRFDISDAGRAVELAGQPDGWLDVARRVVDAHALNVNRRGVVFVQSNEGRLESLVVRVGDCSVAVYQALLEHE